MTPGEYRELVAEHGSPEAAIVANLDRREEIEVAFEYDEREGMRRAFASGGDGILVAHAPRGRKWLEPRVHRLLQEERDALRRAEEDELRRRQLERERTAARGDEGAAPIVPALRPPLPNPTQLRSYTHGTIEKAVKQLAKDGTLGDVIRGSGRVKMSPPDARRVRALWLGALFRFNADGKLLVDGRVARDPKDAKRYVLRYLDAVSTAWLDPKTEPPKP